MERSTVEPRSGDLKSRVDSLPLSNRTLRRLADARIGTVEELLRQSDSDLLGLPGFGHTCLREVRAVLQVFRASGRNCLVGSESPEFPGADLPESILDRRLGNLPIPNRARGVFQRSGIDTVRDYVTAGPERILGLQNFGAVTLHDVNRAIAAAARSLKDGDHFEPLLQVPNLGANSTQELARVPLAALDLPRRARRACLELGIRTLRDFAGLDLDQLLVRRNFGQATLRRIQREVERFLEGEPAGATGFRGLLDSLFARLHEKEQRLIDLREGRKNGESLTLGATGAVLEITESRACQIEHAAWAKLRRFAAGRIEPFANSLETILLAEGGICEPARLLEHEPFAGCDLHPTFVGRLLARLLPHHVSRLHDGRLAAVPAATLCSLGTRLRKRLKRGGPSQELSELVADVGRGLDLGADAATLVRALCENVFHREVAADNDGTLRVRTPAQGLGDDLASTLEASETPLHFTEIARRIGDDSTDAEKVRLRLCRDPRFVLVGRGVYELENRFTVAPTLRERIAAAAERRLAEIGRPTSVTLLHHALESGADLAETSEFVVAKVLREDARFRHLGRGCFGLASNNEESVAHVSDLLREILESAGGPLAYAELRRRVQERRRVSDGAISATLVGRDTFLRVERGWFDLAERHAVSVERRIELASNARERIQRGGGAAALADLARELAIASPVLLGDLLRRHRGFVFVSGGFVRLEDDRLVTELDRRAFESLREAGEPLRPSSLARRLELGAAHAAVLRQALKSSTRVQALGDGRYKAR